MDKLRKFMIDNRGFIKKYLMTDRESWIYTTVGGVHDITSVELSGVMEIPVRTASDLLSGMVKKGWLVRIKAIAPSGGVVYWYSRVN